MIKRRRINYSRWEFSVPIINHVSFLASPADVAACMGVSPWESKVQGPRGISERGGEGEGEGDGSLRNE